MRDKKELCYVCGSELSATNKLTRDCPECTMLMCQRCDQGKGTVCSQCEESK